MLLFDYKIQDAQGNVFKGLVEAKNLEEGRQVLESQGYLIFSLKERRRFLEGASFLRKISPKDMVIMSRQLSILVAASLPLVDALNTLARQTKNEKLKIAISRVADRVEGGRRLSEALAEHPDIFTNFYIKLVETGEQVGKLDEVLEYLASEQEKDYDLRAKIKGMLIYPAFIFFLLVAIVIFMLAFVLPKMLVVLKEANVALPLSTRIVISVSNFFQGYWWLIIIGIVGLAAAFVSYTRTAGGKAQWDTLKLRLPVVGKVVQNISIVRFSNSLGLLLRGGVDMVSALRTVSDVMDNVEYQKLILQAVKGVEDGNFLASTLAQSGYIPYIVIEIIEVGEKTGHVESSLEKVTNFYTREVQNTIATMVALIEPIIIIIMGVGVGLVISAMILPMYRLAGGV